MKYHYVIQGLCITSIFMLNLEKSFASSFDTLTSQQKQRVEAYQPVETFEEVSGTKHRKDYVYLLVNAKAEEATAVYADFKGRSDFLVAGTESKKVLGSVVEGSIVKFFIQYGLKLPAWVGLFTREPIYQVETYIERDPQGFPQGSYKVYWKMIGSGSMDQVEGYLAFEPHGNKTIASYYNFVMPNFMGSNTNKAIQAIEKGDVLALTSIAEHIEDICIHHPDTLKQLLIDMENLLK